MTEILTLAIFCTLLLWCVLSSLSILFAFALQLGCCFSFCTASIKALAGQNCYTLLLQALKP